PHGPSSDYVHVEANPGYERNTGIAGIVGRTIRELAPDEADGWVEIYREVLDTGRPVRFQREFVVAGRHIEVAAHRVEPAERREVALLFRDVTARREAEAALADSEQRLSLAFEASGTVGWYDWDIPADRLRGSDAFARIFGVGQETAAAGAPIADFMRAIHPQDLAAVGIQIQTAMTGHPGFDSQYRLVGADGTVAWVHSLGRISYDPAGQPARFTGIVTDVTAGKRAAERQAALLELSEGLRDGGTSEAIALMGSRLLGVTLGAGRVGYGTVEADGETFTVTRDWTAPSFPTLAGTYRMDDYGGYARDLREGRDVVIADTRADPRTVDSAPVLERVSVRALVNLPVIERGRIVAVLYVNTARPRAWDPDEVAFARQVASLVRHATERRRAEDQQDLLNRELSHRLKNILAMVQAVATQTLRNAPDPATAREALASRLIALGKAHDILMAGTGESADLAVVIKGALAVHDDERQPRFRIEGPTLACAAQPALSVALMMHELATNAAKYGALSVPGGHVTVTWRLGEGAERPELTLVWREHDGPGVTPPTRQGFGSKLIERGLAGSVGGITKLDYPPEGLVCTLKAPVAGFRGEA
ncbi:MAG: PAS domain S-box protein, partial [Parafilimonas terrae]|nr:PAS domain S-box protein [Parafilimonas terrae]